MLNIFKRRIHTRKESDNVNDKWHLKLIVRPNFINVNGQNFHVDRSGLVKLIERVEKREKMVEIGALVGFSTRLFCQYFAEVITVDPYIPGFDNRDHVSGNERLQLAKDLFTIRFLDDPQVTHIQE